MSIHFPVSTFGVFHRFPLGGDQCSGRYPHRWCAGHDRSGSSGGHALWDRSAAQKKPTFSSFGEQKKQKNVKMVYLQGLWCLFNMDFNHHHVLFPCFFIFSFNITGSLDWHWAHPVRPSLPTNPNPAAQRTSCRPSPMAAAESQKRKASVALVEADDEEVVPYSLIDKLQDPRKPRYLVIIFKFRKKQPF